MAIVLLIICSAPVVSKKLIVYLEKDYQLTNLDTVEESDAIVVLSGMVRIIETQLGYRYELTEASDRILAGVDLFKEKKAPIIILTQGKLPWSLGLSEGEYLRDLAIKLGIPKKNIILTELVQNTAQEAKSIKKIFSKNNFRVILVTSAFHMPRAKKVFDSAGINVIPFAVDFLSESSVLTVMDFIPSAKALSQTSFFVREIIGRAYYALKLWK